MAARPHVALIGLAVMWTAGTWASPPMSGAAWSAGAEAERPDMLTPSPRAGSRTERPGPLPASRSEGKETAGQASPSAASLLPSPPAGRETERAAGVPEPVSVDGAPPAGTAQSGRSRGVEARSRLLRSLGERPAPHPDHGSPPTPSGPAARDGQRMATLFGCPREALSALLAGAVEPGDVVSALAIERETLRLCRERQAIVTEIVRLEGELHAAFEASRPPPERPAHASEADGTASRRVVLRLAAPARAEERPAPSEKAAAPAAPDYAWFSILGTPGRLRAGVSDGRRVWFVGEGDRLPGAVRIERITARPPGVRIGGADAGALPYGARPAGDGA